MKKFISTLLAVLMLGIPVYAFAAETEIDEAVPVAISEENGVPVEDVDDPVDIEAVDEVDKLEDEDMDLENTGVDIGADGDEVVEEEVEPTEDDTKDPEFYLDVDGEDPYFNVIAKAYEWGFFGLGEGLFHGETPALRSNVVHIIALIEHAQIAGYDMTTSYVDVPENEELNQQLNWLADTGIMVGYGENRFGLYDAISGEQMAMVIYRLRGNGETYETEAVNCSAWASDAVHFVVENGYMDLDTATTSVLTRNMLAAIMVRLAGPDYVSEF